ncbi:hypothetical protein K488DRAFT_72587 [Vararia minispora EC-137]|uniref:Uncharacterized protein n=1 Tax=Vararia minispora EC-137 TaxID=1314806 RepID=A0ACB8QE15_9AGAM|nr:hypothetical protein K488DRAFT_72587 [Vararia minispora EC-137]
MPKGDSVTTPTSLSMILPPPSSAMNKNMAGLHRGDTVRTNGPPSYDSAVADGPLASSFIQFEHGDTYSPSLPSIPSTSGRSAPERPHTSSSALQPAPLDRARSSSDLTQPQHSKSLPSPPPSHPSSPSRHRSESSPSFLAPGPGTHSSRTTGTLPRSQSSARLTAHSVSTVGTTARTYPPSPASSSQGRTTSPDFFNPSEHTLWKAPTVNGLHLLQEEDIAGAWRLDTDLPPVAKPPKKSRRPRRARQVMEANPNLSLETTKKAGNIAAQLAFVGRPEYGSRKAFVRVTTRAGKVNIDVKEQVPGRHFDLDVYSKSGDSIILIPRSFQGIIELYSGKGKVIVRPTLASAARTLKSSKEEMLLLVGGASAEQSEHMDYVRFSSEGGASVAVGFTAEDDVTVSEHGFWKKFGLMLRGKSTRAVEPAVVPAHI